VLAVNELTRKLVERARKGEGPFFMELMTYRYHGHHVGDINREYYRSKDEEADWKDRTSDPIIRFGKWLEGIATPKRSSGDQRRDQGRCRGRRNMPRCEVSGAGRGRHARLRRTSTTP
jgi:TPP-dependent pyruvate/acetoin dehydrogenase alpha subunit